MIFLYAGLLGIFLFLWFLGRRKFPMSTLPDRKEHPLRIFYPMAAMIGQWIRRIRGSGNDGHIRELLRGIYAKENVEKENRLYRIQKIAAALVICIGFLSLGFLVSLTESTVIYLKSLERAEPGQGERIYELEVDYRGRQEELTLSVEAQHLSESEIRDYFDQSYEAVKTAMLGENVSQEEVTEPLHLLSEYQGISIFWEIEDSQTVNYNGEIRKPPDEGESRMVNLYATFSMDGISEIYGMPVRLTGKTLTETQKLYQQIEEMMEVSNDLQKREVTLPEELDGYPVAFRKKKESQSAVFLLLAIGAVITVILFYDRSLEQKEKKRREQITQDFTEIVSKLNLLYDAGLSIHGAFSRIVEDYEKKESREPRFAYREMKLALEKILSGESETRAYSQFGKRCGTRSYLKLGNLLEQNLNKGAKGMKTLLKKEVEDAYEERKRLARKKGEEASTKMLAPMVMMLLVVIVIIAVPALLSMHF